MILQHIAIMIAREETSTDVHGLLAQLTPAEKVSLLAGADEWQTEGIERLGIGSLKVSAVTILRSGTANRTSR